MEIMTTPGQIVETKKAFADALAILAAHSDWVIDVETNGFDAYGPTQFEEMMRHWSEAIESYLQSQTG